MARVRGEGSPGAGLVGKLEGGVQGVLREFGVVTRAELEDVQLRLMELEHRIGAARAGPAGKHPGKRPGKRPGTPPSAPDGTEDGSAGSTLIHRISRRGCARITRLMRDSGHPEGSPSGSGPESRLMRRPRAPHPRSPADPG